MADIVTNTLQVGNDKLILRDADAQEKVTGLKEDLENNLANLYKNKISGLLGKNLFDKTGEHTPLNVGYYRHYEDGILSPNTGWEVANIFVNCGEKCTINNSNTHVCFFSDYLANSFISGHLVNSTNGFTFTIPNNAVLMCASFNIDRANDIQIEYGVLRTPYESFKYDNISVINKRKLNGVYGKNLFDKTGEHTPITDGYYRNYADGAWSPINGWAVALFDVREGEQYSINNTNTHICFFSDTNATVYVGGFLANVSNGYTFTIPDLAVTMSISIQSDRLNDIQLELGTNRTIYEPFKFGIKNSDIIGASNIFQVGASRYYATIQSAIDAASDGDVIYIDPGVYIEAVDMVGKSLHLIGSGKDNTIIEYAGDDYYYPPLEASKGLLENLSFITTAIDKAENAISTSYCVHIDDDSESNSSLQFVNCYFENPIKHCVGVGLRENFTLNFTNCKFRSGVAPIYCHEQQANNKTGQRIELVDCSIQCTGAESCIRLQESVAYTGNEMTILMQRCIAKANGVSGNNIIIGITYPNAQTPTGSNYLNLSGWYLDEISAMNNEEILNA